MQEITGPRLYEVTVIIRAYALAEDAETAQDIIKENLIEIIEDTNPEMSVQAATPATLDPAWRDAYPWAMYSEARTCQQILEAQEAAARPTGLA